MRDVERFMRIAIEEASRGDYPFGAVIVRDGRIIAREHLGALTMIPLRIQRWSQFAAALRATAAARS
jgi:deoxycytidylate deaminase